MSTPPAVSERFIAEVQAIYAEYGAGLRIRGALHAAESLTRADRAVRVRAGGCLENRAARDGETLA